MTTRITRSPAVAARFIREGALAAFPTETVYGLGADAFNEKAIRKIFAAKGRPSDNPLIVHVADASQIERLVTRIPPSAVRFMDAFFPGPLTLILPKRKEVSLLITAGLSTVGVRMPSLPLTQKFLHDCGTPVVAPSANRSGNPSPTTLQAVMSDLQGRIACILKGGQTIVGLESTVVDCTGTVPKILRTGALSLEQLREVVSATRIARETGSRPSKSPGMKYRHYAPRARVVIVDSPADIPRSSDGGYIGTIELSLRHRLKLVKVCLNVEDYAHALFLFFRRCDEAKVRTIYAQSVPETGLGLALMDRIRRAAHR